MTTSVRESRKNPRSDDIGTERNRGGALADAQDQLRAAIAGITAVAGADVLDEAASRDAIQSAARALVDDLRRRNEPPEKMLIQIKRILGEAGLQPSFPASIEGETIVAPLANVYRQVIEWSIRYYYGADSPPEINPR